MMGSIASLLKRLFTFHTIRQRKDEGNSQKSAERTVFNINQTAKVNNGKQIGAYFHFEKLEIKGFLGALLLFVILASGVSYFIYEGGNKSAPTPQEYYIEGQIVSTMSRPVHISFNVRDSRIVDKEYDSISGYFTLQLDTLYSADSLVHVTILSPDFYDASIVVNPFEGDSIEVHLTSKPIFNIEPQKVSEYFSIDELMSEHLALTGSHTIQFSLDRTLWDSDLYPNKYTYLGGTLRVLLNAKLIFQTEIPHFEYYDIEKEIIDDIEDLFRDKIESHNDEIIRLIIAELAEGA